MTIIKVDAIIAAQETETSNIQDQDDEILSRFRDAQQQRTVLHPKLPQPHDHYASAPKKYCDKAASYILETKKPKRELSSSIPQTTTSVSEKEPSRHSYSFVVCADTQIGMYSQNKEWETELAYSRQAVELINSLNPRPLWCIMCGDIADMELSFYENTKGFTRNDCFRIQKQQYADFQKVYAQLHPDICMVCVCGNHDIGNRPTPASMDIWKNAFGDDTVAFWVNGTYNICLNTTLIKDHSAPGSQELYDSQLEWLKDRLAYAKTNHAGNIFVFGHHPWFIYSEDEIDEDMTGISPEPKHWGFQRNGVPDYYFHIPLEYRRIYMELFREYGVSASFSGHFHQNMVSKSSFGMDMIITSSLSTVFDSTGKPKSFISTDPNCRGIRLVDVQSKSCKYQHRFLPLDK